ncbi:DUF992 domain-containing protein [Mangrovibrevibacter kandeliae]|uniref:DUF992 domain-containing protein n=1 Tax=Mangrovibrevibacter kandeliae TaxID=2968473 RepID=UPI002119AB84|nr:DUF992 domain-containing protein [Aurantimonas sp. CSK15Z-1]MCQ8780838.1 DUF992 domain-containing protein [Aurantimonas sp. CSK15Z-1]
MRLRSAALALAAGAAALAPMSAFADAKLGTLTCHSDGHTGFIIGSSDNVVCAFTPANDAIGEEVYAGTISNIGLDVGITGETLMTWTVLAASLDTYEPGSLAGTYVGASADASFAAGGGAKVLVGGPSDGFTLQPLSLQAQEGVNAALGVTNFTLKAAHPVAVAPAATTTTTVVVPK